MSSKVLEQAIREKIHYKNGKDFQQLFWDVMILRLSDLQTPRMLKDLGNDGYSIQGKIFFACHGTEDSQYDNKKTVKKIKDDYQLFCDNWKSKYPFTTWAFVTKANLMGQPHQTLLELNSNGDGITKQNLGLEQFVREVLCLEIADIRRIFELPESYEINAVQEESDFGIIADIFEFIFANKINNSDPSSIKQSNGYTELTEKLSLNFSGDELISVREMIVRNWARKDLVAKYMQGESDKNSGRIDALIDTVQSDFRQLKHANHHTTPIESVRVIEELARKYLKEDKQSNPEYVANSRAIVLYLFELCFLGKKTETENKNEVVVF